MTIIKTRGTEKYPDCYAFIDKYGRKVAAVESTELANKVMAAIGQYDTWDSVPLNIRMKLAMSGIMCAL